METDDTDGPAWTMEDGQEDVSDVDDTPSTPGRNDFDGLLSAGAEASDESNLQLPENNEKVVVESLDAVYTSATTDLDSLEPENAESAVELLDALPQLPPVNSKLANFQVARELDEIGCAATNLLKEVLKEEHPEALEESKNEEANETIDDSALNEIPKLEIEEPQDNDEKNVGSPVSSTGSSSKMFPTRRSQRREDMELREKAEEIRRQTLEEEKKFLASQQAAQNKKSAAPVSLRAPRQPRKQSFKKDSSTESDAPLSAKVEDVKEEKSNEAEGSSHSDELLAEMKPCSVVVYRLTEHKLKKWTGLKNPPVWRPKMAAQVSEENELKMKISLKVIKPAKQPSKRQPPNKRVKKEVPEAPSAINVPPPREPKKRVETDVKKLIKERSLPRALPTSTSHMPVGGDRCFNCRSNLGSDLNEFSADSKSAYCSHKCIQEQVQKATQLLSNSEDHVIVIENGTGRVLGAPLAPKLSVLSQWLVDNPCFVPLLPNKGPKPPVEKTEADSSTESKSKAQPPPDTVRLNVRKAFKDALSSRLREADELLLTSNEVKDIAIRIEEAVFREHRKMSGDYKKWCKHFLLNVKNPSNKGLFRRVLTGEVSASKLASYRPEQLNCPELYRMPQLSLSSNTPATPKTAEKSKTKPVSSSQRASGDALSSILGGITDTTAEHKSHLFDLNCKICTGKHQAEMEKKIKNEEKAISEAKQIISAQKEQMLRDQMAEELATQEAVAEAPRPRGPYTPPEPDTFSSPVPKRPNIEYESPKPSAPSPFPAEPTVENKDPEVWSGTVTMHNYYNFDTSGLLVSGGDPGYKLRNRLPDMLKVVGRIPPHVVWKYLIDVKQANAKDVCVLKFEAPRFPSDKQQYDGLFENMLRKDRFSVIGELLRPVKDLYLLPLSEHQAVPVQLLPFQGGIGLGDNRGNLILGIVVQYRVKELPPAPPPEPVEIPIEQPQQQQQQQQERREGLLDFDYGDESPYDPFAGEEPTPKEPETQQQHQFSANDFQQASPTQVLVSASSFARDTAAAAVRDVVYGGAGLPAGFVEPDPWQPTTSTQEQEQPSQSSQLSSADLLKPSVGDLLIHIHTGEDPAEIAATVQHFMTENTLTQQEQELVLNALSNKVEQETQRRMTAPEQSEQAREILDRLNEQMEEQHEREQEIERNLMSGIYEKDLEEGEINEGEDMDIEMTDTGHTHPIEPAWLPPPPPYPAGVVPPPEAFPPPPPPPPLMNKSAEELQPPPMPLFGMGGMPVPPMPPPPPADLQFTEDMPPPWEQLGMPPPPWLQQQQHQQPSVSNEGDWREGGWEEPMEEQMNPHWPNRGHMQQRGMNRGRATLLGSPVPLGMGRGRGGRPPRQGFRPPRMRHDCGYSEVEDPEMIGLMNVDVGFEPNEHQQFQGYNEPFQEEYGYEEEQFVPFEPPGMANMPWRGPGQRFHGFGSSPRRRPFRGRGPRW